MCTHKLGPDYPGRFCIYCGNLVASIYAKDGQIVLDNKKQPRFVAVIYKNQQKPVARIDMEGPTPQITFTDGKEASTNTSCLILAFQRADEMLAID